MSVKSIAHTYCPSFLKPLFIRIENSPIASRLARGVFWSMAGAVISRGLMLCSTVLVARLLGKTVYGEFGMIRSTVGMFGIFAAFGLSLTATKHVAEYRKNDPERAGRIIGLSWLVAAFTGGLAGMGLFIFAPWLAEHTLNAPHLAGVLRIGSLIMFLDALNGTQTGALSGFEAFKTIALVNLFVGLLSFPVLVGCAYFAGLTGVVCGLGINLSVQWLLNHLALRRESKRYGVTLTFKKCRNELSVLWRFSLPATLGGVLVSPAFWVCNAMLVNQQGGYGELGIFTAALIFQNLLLLTSQFLTAPLLPMLASVGSEKTPSLEAANILISWGIGLLPSLVMLCFPEALEFLFGREYQGYSFRLTVVIVLFYTCILTYRSGLMRVLHAKGLIWLGFCNNLVWALILVPIAHYFVQWGSMGLAISIAIAYVLNSIIFVPLYLKYCEIRIGLVLSSEAIAIWTLLCILIMGVVFKIPIIYRAAAMPISLYMAVYLLKRIWTRHLAFRPQYR